MIVLVWEILGDYSDPILTAVIHPEQREEFIAQYISKLNKERCIVIKQECSDEEASVTFEGMAKPKGPYKSRFAFQEVEPGVSWDMPELSYKY